MKIVLDSNCFIDDLNQESRAYMPLQEIFKASNRGKIALFVSLHSLHELERKPDEAFALAKSLPLLLHYPIGSWEEQVGAWSQLAGTWEDAKRNKEIQQGLKNLAKSGADLRDLGAYIDALYARADVFVTSDKDLVGKGPSNRIAEKYKLRIVTPEKLAAQLFSNIF